ncbi:MerR family transcriptional regulator [Oceaniradius stylonematis]|jgi:MerR family transcriptional regulator, aldehyde-responsive regulator|uniref:MerR family transcriptional regulator n=1 Tax=Oceaniradius stylonematis TaxID=2184161 RepID=UPI0035CF6392
MKISEVAERTGLSISTIRYYEKSGLCPPITRGADGKRQFTKTDVDWLLLLSSLRETGMPTSEMLDFAALYRSGNETIPERKAALLTHRQRLTDRQAELDRCRNILDRKLAKYDEIMGDQA